MKKITGTGGIAVAVGLTIAVIGWLFPDIEISTRIIWTMGSVVFMLLINVGLLSWNLYTLTETHKKLDEKYKAILLQYKDKKRAVTAYEWATDSMWGILEIYNAMHDPKKLKLEQLVESIAICFKQIERQDDEE